jgi:hypothetical protein
MENAPAPGLGSALEAVGIALASSRYRSRAPQIGNQDSVGKTVMKLPAEGGCLCGAVRYQISFEPRSADYCHCRMCRRAAGAPVVARVTVADAARLDQGQACRLPLVGRGRTPVLPGLRHTTSLARRARSPGRHARKPGRSRGRPPALPHLDVESDRLVRDRGRSGALSAEPQVGLELMDARPPSMAVPSRVSL